MQLSSQLSSQLMSKPLFLTGLQPSNQPSLHVLSHPSRRPSGWPAPTGARNCLEIDSGRTMRQRGKATATAICQVCRPLSSSLSNAPQLPISTIFFPPEPFHHHKFPPKPPPTQLSTIFFLPKPFHHQKCPHRPSLTRKPLACAWPLSSWAQPLLLVISSSSRA